MKIRQLTTIINLEEEEVTRAVIKYILKKKKLAEVIDSYLTKSKRTSELKVYKINKIIKTTNGVRIEVLASSEPPAPSFTKKNKGFLKALTKFINDCREKKYKEISFDEYMQAMQEIYPMMNYRRLYTYISDKRFQRPKNIVFDTKRKVIILL
jgi:hypothetical protein